MPQQNIIAMIFDCDDTLCNDSTTFLLEGEGIKADIFWRNVNRMVREGWDPPLAYMKHILDLNAKRKERGRKLITVQSLHAAGSKLKFYPGVPKFFEELKKTVASDSNMRADLVELEFYVISSGFEEIIQRSKISRYLNGFCGCSFEADANGEILFPKTAITFTEKTKYMFAINKGISFDNLRKNPYAVNSAVEEDKRRVPFSNMIYVGDGPSDIPCLSTIRKLGGKVVGVYTNHAIRRGYQLAKGGRTTVGPYLADYQRGSELRKMLEMMIQEIGVEIHRRTAESVVAAPSH